jgi:glucose-6-phosphate 1-epimerase
MLGRVHPVALDARFGVPGIIAFEPGSGGLTRAVVTTAAATAHVYLHGAHVAHFQPASSAPALFLSPRSAFAPGRAIRGGVPVIFPWFGPNPDDPRAPDHGFARTAEWAVESVEVEGEIATLALALEASEATRAVWPHAFRLRYRISIGTALDLAVTVENRSPAVFSFQEALHTYLHVGDVEEASVRGLEDTTYIDKADNMARKAHGREPVRLRGLTDRVYLDTEHACEVDDPVLGRRLSIAKRGSRTTVIWNPGRDVARGMADLGAEAWRSMLCVETANAADNTVRLGPGQRHEMAARLTVASADSPGALSPRGTIESPRSRQWPV